MKTISVVLFVLLVTSFAPAQQRWAKTYGGTSNDAGNSVQQTADGGYIVAGYTNSFGQGGDDVYLIKTNAAGDTAWTRTCGGAGNDEGYSVQQTSDGGYVVAGTTLSFGAGFRDVYLIKMNASGDTVWTRTYGGANDEHGYSVQQTSDGGYVIAGGTDSHGAGGYDVYLVKTKSNGDTLWTRTYGGTGDDEGRSVRQTSDGGYIVAGYTKSFDAGSDELYLIKTNASGDTLWTRTCTGGLAAEGYSVRQTSDGGYIVGGYDYPTAATSYDFYLVKTNASGDTLWTRTYNGSGVDRGTSVWQTSDGGYVISGWAYTVNPSYSLVLLIKTSSSGDTLWTRYYGGGGEQQANCVQQTSDGGYVLAGFTNSFGAGGFDVYLIETDANGSAGVEEPAGSGQKAVGSIEAVPNLFASFTRIPGHEGERFSLYDISGKIAGTYRGDRIGEGLAPAVYFIKLSDEHGGALRVVKAGT